MVELNNIARLWSVWEGNVLFAILFTEGPHLA